jgi:regulator of PEP synthase PpsR (kinase-PPPase family)
MAGSDDPTSTAAGGDKSAGKSAERDANEMGEIFVISDGTGETGAAAVRAVMLQFRTPWRLRIFGGIRHPSEVRRVMAQAAEANALVVFSLVEKREAAELLREAERFGLATVDLLGPLIARAAQHLKAEPRHEPGLLHGFSDDYFQRIEAVAFAVRHDDGANLHTLHEADIVLTGVSRTSKTPLTMYLAQRGYKTGNVPLVAGLDPSQDLCELDRRKVFGLDIDPSTLLTVRQARLKSLRTSPHSKYTDTTAISEELERARRLFRQYGWASIDISGRAVEENASRIIEIYQSNPPSSD